MVYCFFAPSDDPIDFMTEIFPRPLLEEQDYLEFFAKIMLNRMNSSWY